MKTKETPEKMLEMASVFEREGSTYSAFVMREMAKQLAEAEEKK